MVAAFPQAAREFREIVFVLLSGIGRVPLGGLARPLRSTDRAIAPTSRPPARWAPGRVGRASRLQASACRPMPPPLGGWQSGPRREEKQVLQMLLAIALQSLGPPFEFLLLVRQRSSDLSPPGSPPFPARQTPRADWKGLSPIPRRALPARHFPRAKSLRTPTVSRRPAKIWGVKIFSSACSLSPEPSVSKCPARLPLSTLDT